jgi:hypothetical protein
MLNHKYCRAHTGLSKVSDENCSAVTQKPKKKNEPKEKSASAARFPSLQSAPSAPALKHELACDCCCYIHTTVSYDRT